MEIENKLAEYIKKNYQDLKNEVLYKAVESRANTVEEAIKYYKLCPNDLERDIKIEAEKQLTELYEQDQVNQEHIEQFQQEMLNDWCR